MIRENKYKKNETKSIIEKEEKEENSKVSLSKRNKNRKLSKIINFK